MSEAEQIAELWKELTDLKRRIAELEKQASKQPLRTAT